MTDEEYQLEVSQLIDEARHRLKNAIELDSKVQMQDAIDALINAVDLIHKRGSVGE